MSQTAESARLFESDHGLGWRRWGPYRSERQWGTEREDYSPDGEAWSYFTHDQARSLVYLPDVGAPGWSVDAPEVPPGHRPARSTPLMSSVRSAGPGGGPGRADRRQG